MISHMISSIIVKPTPLDRPLVAGCSINEIHVLIISLKDHFRSFFSLMFVQVSDQFGLNQLFDDIETC